MKTVRRSVPGCICAVLLTLAFGSGAASASNWLECEGRATVTKAVRGEDGFWQLSATVDEAAVTGGFGATGAHCGEAGGDVVISSEEEIATGKTVRFKYSYYGALGPQGPVTRRTWERLP